MTFTTKEQIAIRFLVQELIKADGLVLPVENVCWNTVSLKMKWPEPDADELAAFNMEKALAVLDLMDEEKKRFAKAFFKMIILADERIAPEEQALLNRINDAAHLPILSIADATKLLEHV